jgi:hypothetical protein
MVNTIGFRRWRLISFAVNCHYRNPADPAATQRVITICLAEEY